MTNKKATHATTHDDAQASQAQEGPQAAQPAAAATAAPAAGADAAVVDAQAATPAKVSTPARDEHTGRGGLYRRNKDGSRSLIERTQQEAG